MSLRDLARQHLETMAKPSLSGVRTYRGVRPGQNHSSPYSSTDEACPDALRNPDSLSGPDKCEASGQVGHFGQVGQSVTQPAPVPTYDPARLQRDADRRNAAAARERITDRVCRCGHLATFAWPGNDGRDAWICAECLPTRGRA